MPLDLRHADLFCFDSAGLKGLPMTKRERMLDVARQYQTSTYIRKFVAPDFQLMIRSEAAALPPNQEFAVVNGGIEYVWREFGQCVCVTCGKVGPWKGNAIGGGTIETGHFLASRRNSIVLEESNAHPQCKHCNQHLSGNQGNYEIWMQHVYGQEEIDRLRKLKTESRKFTHDELVDLRIEFRRRLKVAQQAMELR